MVTRRHRRNQGADDPEVERRLADWRRAAEEFFYKHGAYSYPSGADEAAKERARREAARDLAAAEEHAEDAGWAVEWEHDQDPDISWMDDEQLEEMDRGVTEMLTAVLKDEDGNVLAALGGIHLSARGRRDPYGRVVEAELASEALAQIGRRPLHRENSAQSDKVMRAAESSRYGAAGAFRTSGGVVYSYDLPIARFDYPPVVLDKKRSPSTTTSKHIGFVRRAWPNARVVEKVI